METTVRNLELSWHDQLEGDALEDVGDMAGGLPFEKQREHQLHLDRPAIASDAYGRSHPRRQYLTAYFGDELVGVMAITTIGDSAENPEQCLLEHEFVQRNRDDIRGRLLNTVHETYPDATLHLQIPAQNRTARQYLQRHDRIDVESTTTVLQLYWPIGETTSEPDDTTVNLEDVMTSPIGSLVADDQPAREALEIIDDGPIRSRSRRTRDDHQTQQLLSVEAEESGQLLETIHEWATDQTIDHLEWPVTESFLEGSPSLTDSLEIINKRIHHRFTLN